MFIISNDCGRVSPPVYCLEIKSLHFFLIECDVHFSKSFDCGTLGGLHALEHLANAKHVSSVVVYKNLNLIDITAICKEIN